MYGGVEQEPIYIDIDPDAVGQEIVPLDRGVVPVAYRAIREASDSGAARNRPRALFAQGAPSGFYQFLELCELYEHYKTDGTDEFTPAEKQQVL